MRAINTLIMAVVTLSAVAQPQVGNKIEILTADVEYLAHDALEGRETGTEGEALAAGYIAARFQELGLMPLGDDGSYFQSFTRKVENNPHAVSQDTSEVITGRNVVGFWDNGAENTIVLGAHYDHLGWGHEGSLHAGGDAIHNGADDNASGVAGIMMIAKIVCNRYVNNNYVIIAFSGEEKGLWGSNFYCKNATFDLSTCNYMINLDMVGRMNEENTLAINGVGTSPLWMERLDEVNTLDLNLVTSESGVGPSDHTSFYLQDIPVLHFFTGQHEDYHKPTDDVELVNYEGILAISQYISLLIADLDTKGKLEFTKTNDDTSDTPRFTVTLGVIPDYLFDGVGMRIDGVTEGRPAANAGIEKGDIVIRMDDHEVTDMMGYMEALSQYEEGDKATVAVLRGTREMEFKVKF